jgi:pimeloyl-ACP methyl ester carboxylesterase
LHRIGYAEWGRRDAPVVMCVHGLTRNGRDFDPLAQRLSDRYRVICPDMIGRGTSDRAADPSLYAIPQYVADCVTLVARLDVGQLTWIGTSMGGLIGMALAALPGNAIARLILNDVGPVIEAGGLARIGRYVGTDPVFESFEDGEQALRELTAEFGPHSDEQFRYLSRHYVVRRDGKWKFHYDPAIAAAVKAAPPGPPPAMWPLYDAISCPTRVVRGENSDILGAAVAVEMTRRGPCARVEQIPGVGHAPTFIADDQIAVIERLLTD